MIIPLADADRQQFDVRLGARIARLTVWRQPSDGGWYISVERPVGTRLASGRRLVDEGAVLTPEAALRVGGRLFAELAPKAPERSSLAPPFRLVWRPGGGDVHA